MGAAYSGLIHDGEVLLYCRRARDRDVNGRCPVPTRGGASTKAVTWDEVIKEESKESLINSFIEDRINSAMGLRPAEYLEYLGHIIESQLLANVIDPFSELCATRDLIVHVQGKISEEYIAKAGSLSRGTIGDVLVMDRKYFNASMSNIKDLYSEICSSMPGTGQCAVF